MFLADVWPWLPDWRAVLQASSWNPAGFEAVHPSLWVRPTAIGPLVKVLVHSYELFLLGFIMPVWSEISSRILIHLTRFAVLQV